MNLTLIRNDRLFSYSLPDEIAGRHWLFDVSPQGRKRKLAAVDAKDGRWELSSHGNTRLLAADGTEVKSLELSKGYGLYHLSLPEGDVASLLVEIPRALDKKYNKVGFSGDLVIEIGSNPSSMLCFDNPHLSLSHAQLFLENEQFSIIDTSDGYGVYLNAQAIPKKLRTSLKFGDVVWIMGLKIAIGRRFIAHNNPGGAVKLTPHPKQVNYTPQELAATEESMLEDEELDLFYRSPRIKRDIERKTLQVEGPPNKEKPDESPVILKIGPSIGMALGSAMMGVYMLSMIASGQGSPMRALPMGTMMIVMILGAVLWPNLSRRYERRKANTQESKRKAAYAAYLDKIRVSLQEETALQHEILEENRITVQECLSRTINQDRRLFERTVLHSDFLELRIGYGNAPLDMDIKFPQDQLTVEEDVLKSLVNDLAKQPRLLVDVPLTLSLVDDYVCGVVASREDYYPFMRGLIAQICALHAPDEVKIVLFGDSEDEYEWHFVRSLPHAFDSSWASRFLVTEQTEEATVALRLERETQQRADKQAGHPGDYGIYYVVIVANRELASTSDVLAKLSALRANKGCTVLTFAEKIRELPKECTRIIELSDDAGITYDPRDASGERAVFVQDIALTAEEANGFAEALGAIRLDQAEARNALPKTLGFLEMFEAGKVEHLNIKTRWAESNPTVSLAAPLGVDATGALSQLDVHEDFHGPHGLVAGMTGSGKSESIITYILSLAVNYRPDEVSFVLIDYKGGGLAGAFDNERARLPHLAGTITNLDGAAIARSLISIQSELKRRQALFNVARDVSGSGTMNIYAYQRLHREGVMKEPCPHLFVIADEFAELKSQQPEFMDQLISAARIGRSLGVHLVLATQKPSGVVNDQIWSNSRFKLCLKVADAADSNEMLKRPDAAELTDAGRYYLQVGYNEYFALGQSAYAGATYQPKDLFEKKRDRSVVLISNCARPLAAASPEQPKQRSSAKLPESQAVLWHLAQVAEEEGLAAPRLWLDQIPAHITVDTLDEKYPRAGRDPFIIDPVIGEYDNPYTQSQGLLTLPLTSAGNALLFGATGSGKSVVLGALVYSLIKDHDATQLNAYILDFGAETLGAFIAAPQVGDVAFSGEEEKVRNLIRMLGTEIGRRRKALSSFGGSLLRYNHQAQKEPGLKPLPSILVIINNYDLFVELYPQCTDDLIRLTRDGARYGIYFLLSCMRATAVTYRMLPNFKQRLSLELNTKDEYITVFGSIREVVPAKGLARGLVKLEHIFEFQGAHISEDPDKSEYEAIGEACERIVGQQLEAPVIPTLPEKVTLEMLLSEGVHRARLPVGISSSTLETACFDFGRSPALMVIGEDESKMLPLLEGFIKLLQNISSAEVVALDPDHMLLANHSKSKVFQERTAINEFINELSSRQSLDNLYLILVSVRSIHDLLDASSRAVFENFIKSGQYRHLGGLIISGEPSRFSTFSFEAWWRDLASYGNGIWIGDGMHTQSILKVNRQLQEFREPLEKSLAWFVNKGNALLIKHIT